MTDKSIEQRILDAFRQDELEKLTFEQAREKVKLAEEELEKAKKALEEMHYGWGRETAVGALYNQLLDEAREKVALEKDRHNEINVGGKTRAMDENVQTGPGLEKPEEN